MAWTPLLRTSLVEALTTAGDDAPTLCTGWRSRHLAAHLVLRQSDPLYGLSMLMPPLQARAEFQVQTTGDDTPYDELLAAVAGGPPAWHPVRWFAEQADLVELWIHTQDVLRGAGDVPPGPGPALSDVLWSRTLSMARLSARRSPVGLVLVRTDGVRAAVRRPPSGRGTVVLRGEPGELLLAVSGRVGAARVSLEGDDTDVAAFTGAPLGM